MKTIKIVFVVLGFILFFTIAFALFEPSADPTGFFVYVPNLAIINYDNNEPLNSELKIDFMTSGTNDLIITSLKGDMEFMELKCDNQISNPVIDDNKIIYNDFIYLYVIMYVKWHL